MLDFERGVRAVIDTFSSEEASKTLPVTLTIFAALGVILLMRMMAPQVEAEIVLDNRYLGLTFENPTATEVAEVAAE